MQQGYLNDVERCLKYSEMNIYYDDTNITIASNNKEKLVADAQAELHNITEWMRVNKLSPNSSEPEYAHTESDESKGHKCSQWIKVR